MSHLTVRCRVFCRTCQEVADASFKGAFMGALVGLSVGSTFRLMDRIGFCGPIPLSYDPYSPYTSCKTVLSVGTILAIPAYAMLGGVVATTYEVGQLILNKCVRKNGGVNDG